MRPYKCSICKKTIMGLGYMMVHVEKHIADNKAYKITNDTKDTKDTNINNKLL